MIFGIITEVILITSNTDFEIAAAIEVILGAFPTRATQLSSLGVCERSEREISKLSNNWSQTLVGINHCFNFEAGTGIT